MNFSNSIYFLCKTPNQVLIDFAKEILNAQFCNVFIVVDDNSFIANDKMFIQVSDEVCISTGYYNINESIAKNPSAWDKVVYHLCKKSNENFCFIIEDDVFIPSVNSIKNLFKYEKYDLVSPFNKMKKEHISNDSWVWSNVVNKINEPYFYSMVCALGVSRRLINVIKEYVSKSNTLFYLEVIFNTLANHKSLNIIVPNELSTIIYDMDWTNEEISSLPNNLFHPIKDKNQHYHLRKLIEKSN